MQHVNDIIDSIRSSFTWFDYIVFIAMLVICSGMGIYFALKDSGKTETKDFEEEYLVGGRKMKIFPVSMSLIATWVSGISIMGNTTEFYLYGSGFGLMCLSMVIAGFIMVKFILPVYVELEIMSTYEYLQIRFDRRVRIFGAVIYVVCTILLMSIVIYVPALAFNQVSGANIQLISSLVCAICIFYTCIGGFKAVIWTDLIQGLIMFATILLIIIKGIHNAGGLSSLWEKNYNSGRISLPEWTMDLTQRISLPTVLLGTVYCVQTFTVHQSYVQRYLSVPDLKSAKIAVWILIVGIIVIILECGTMGLIAYAIFHDCDPLSTKLITATDQLLPLLVMKISKNIPGFPGIFVAGIFSAALSTLSTGLNCLSAIVLEDFIKPFRRTHLTNNQKKYILQGVVLICGIFAVLLIFVVERLGNVQQLTMSFVGASTGPLLGVFLLGFMVPWVNGKSALFGGVLGVAVMAWVTLKAQTAIAMGELAFPTKPMSIEGCNYEFSNASAHVPSVIVERGHQIYHMSFLLYSVFGVSTCILFALISMPVFGANKMENFNLQLISPCLRSWIKPEINRTSELQTIEEKTKLTAVES